MTGKRLRFVEDNDTPWRRRDREKREREKESRLVSGNAKNADEIVGWIIPADFANAVASVFLISFGFFSRS